MKQPTESYVFNFKLKMKKTNSSMNLKVVGETALGIER